MPPPTRNLTEADQALWTNYARYLSPLRGRVPKSANVSLPEPPSPGTQPQQPPPKASKPRMIASPVTVGVQPGGLDKATWRRFQSGKLASGRTLDLHGMTAQRAFQALVSFLRAAHAEQVRCVEIVTGRGNGETGGVIRREFPHWLNLPEIRPLILGAAHPHALNPGSVRLILRRIR